jgi:predicted GTPase
MPNKMDLNTLPVVSDELVKKYQNILEATGLKLKVIMAGKTGVGKTSVLNAIFHQEVGKVATDGEPCTKKNSEIFWPTATGDIIYFDVPGFGEANAPSIDGLDYMENIYLHANNAQLLALVLKCDDKALDLEEKFLKKWQEDDRLKNLPVFIVINQIDKMKPVREWNPDTINLDKPSTKKELMIQSYVDYVAHLPSFRQYALSGHIFPVSAGEYLEDPTYGIDRLRTALMDHTPEMLQTIFIDAQKSRDDQAMNTIKKYSIVCAVATVQPIPLLDWLAIAGPQIMMVTRLARIYGIKLSRGVIAGILNTVVMAALGNAIYFTIVSAIPIVKQILQPALAYQLTYTAGCVINELFKGGKVEITKAEAQALASKYKAEAKRLANDYAKKQAT